MWNLFKANNKDTRTVSMSSVWCLYCQLWTYFKISFNVFLLTLNRPKSIGVFSLLHFLLSLKGCFCFGMEKTNYFYRNRLSKLPVPYFIVEVTVMCIAHNTNQPLLCCVFHFTFSFPVTGCAGHNTDLPSNSNISKTVKTVFKQHFLKSIW